MDRFLGVVRFDVWDVPDGVCQKRISGIEFPKIRRVFTLGVPTRSVDTINAFGFAGIKLAHSNGIKIETVISRTREPKDSLVAA